MSDNNNNDDKLEIEKVISLLKKLLTGDQDFDTAVLIDIYQDIPDEMTELKKAVWDLLYETMPESLRANVSPDGTKRGLVKQHVGYDYTEIPENVLNHKPETIGEWTLDSILKAQRYIEEGENAKAFLEIATSIEALKHGGILKDSLDKNERNFDHPIEREYIRLMEPDDRPEGEANIARLFYRSGFLMNEIGRLSEAEKELKKALVWDPTSYSTLLELANTYKGLNKPPETFTYAEAALNYAFEPNQISAAWRSMGFALVELEMYAQAAACFYEALRYDPESEVAKTELDYISYKAGIGIPEKNMNDTIELANELEIDLKKPYKMYKFLERVAKETDDENLREYAEKVAEDLKPRVDSLLKDIENATVKLEEINPINPDDGDSKGKN